MNSFTSHFKPWLLALAGVLVIELAYYAAVRPPRVQWNAFLDLKFAVTESFQRLVAYEKIVAFAESDPHIIQVGDSSGLHGVQPPVVMSHIPGYEYLNLSVATTLGYTGYYNLAQIQLERSRNVRYIVLYASPLGGVPRRTLWDADQRLMAPLIHNEFTSPLHALVQLPTLASRLEVLDFVYFMGHRFKARGTPLSTNRGYLAFLSVFRESNGWTRETDVEGDVTANIYRAILPGTVVGEKVDPAIVRAALRTVPKVSNDHFFDWSTLSHVSYFEHVYGAFAGLARKHGARLVVIFNPVPESSRSEGFDELIEWNDIKASLARVARKHPDIIFSDIEFWPDEKFSVFSHVSTLYSEESSARVGRIMKKVIGDAPPPARAGRAATDSLPAKVEIDFDTWYCGYGWTDARARTDAFPLQYVGPRNRAWVYTSVQPGGPYTVRSRFRADDPGTAERIEMRANEVPARKIAAGREGEDLYAEWLVPAEAINAYGGWLKLEFAPEGAGMPAEAVQKDGQRNVAFRRAVLMKVPGRQ